VLGRKRFADLVSRQLELFEEDARELLDEAADADGKWTHASAEDSEELYGDYQLVVDEVAERLLDVRETYAATLDDGPATDYRKAFNRAALNRFRAYAALLLDER
jgi:hypothetical protein